MTSMLLRAGRSVSLRSTPAFLQKRTLETNVIADHQRQMVNEKKTVLQLLYNIGSKEEVDQYLNMFSSVDTQKFAVIKVGGGVLEKEMDALSSSLAFLYKVGLTPIVVHGAGPQLNKILEAAKIEPRYNEGIRITDSDTLSIARRVFYSQNFLLVEALEKIGIRARSVLGGTFIADYLDQEKYGFVGNVTGVNLEHIDSCIKSGSLPIVSSISETRSGQILNINADVAASELAKAVKPLKVVFINETGGLMHGETGKRIPAINLDEEYESLMKEPWVKYGTRLKIREIKELLDDLPRSASVSITSTNHLSKELFTHKGAGTFIRRGFKIHTFDSTSNANMQKLKELLSKAPGFDSGVLDALQGRKFRIYADEDYQFAAVVVEEPGQIPVMAYCYGEPSSIDIRDNIWSRVRKDHSTLTWAIDKNREDQSWFFRQSEGSFSADGKTVFWYGLKGIDEAKSAVSRAGNPFSSNAGQTRGYASSAGIKRIGMLGARGYVGQEVIRILEAHRHLDLVSLSSRELQGKPVEGYTPKDGQKALNYESLTPEACVEKDLDCWIMALPNGLCKPYVDAIRSNPKNKNAVILDLSADYRFDKTWQYGLTERFRDDIAKAKNISNPGCYATGAQCSLLPAHKHFGFKSVPSVFGVSGYSGAGTKPSKNNDPAFLKDNLAPYTLTNHVHEREVSYQLGTQIFFIPHVASWFQGIALTTSMHFEKPTNAQELYEAYAEYFKQNGKEEPLIRVQKEIPYVKDNSKKHHVTIGGFNVSADGHHGVVVTTLDNLLKGAATQAIQNINLALGLDELEGFNLK